ncbi:hypothetical protein GCM10009617_36130 [Leifsonia poae]|uniref:Uncharacterized protein n=1 Tax=Leifsonia poae TaxID=110933 RepID=A0A9W6HAJ1_9MICO|nr:hypothetical protein GCM10017584_20920 [Leifsonia poae]
MVSRYEVDGWVITADPHTPIGRLAALTAETACVPFINLNRITTPAIPLAGRAAGPALHGLS